MLKNELKDERERTKGVRKNTHSSHRLLSPIRFKPRHKRKLNISEKINKKEAGIIPASLLRLDNI